MDTELTSDEKKLIIQNWANQLKSGNYVQAFGTIRTEDGSAFCAIGVLFDQYPELIGRTKKLLGINIGYISKLNDKYKLNFAELADELLAMPGLVL